MTDILDDGHATDPAAPRPQWLAAAATLIERGRGVLGALAVAAIVLGTAVVSGHQHGPGPGAATAAPRGQRAAAAPRQVQIQLLLDQYGFSVEPGGFSLQLSLVNYGSRPVDVLATHLPQAGARPVPGPGGDEPFASPVALKPDLFAMITIPVRVTCPGVLTAPLADHLDLTLGDDGRPLDVVHVALAPLGSLVDDARHAACGVASASATIYPTYLVGSLRATAARLITATVRVSNVGDAPATVVVLGAEPASVQVGPLGRAVTVAPGAAIELALHWQILDCAAAGAVRWPTLRLSITVPTSTVTNAYGLDQTFGTPWRAALAGACSQSRS